MMPREEIIFYPLTTEERIKVNCNYHDLDVEKKVTQDIPKWREKLLERVSSLLGSWGNWATRVGTGRNETQIRFEQPISAMFSFEPLNILYVQFNVLWPQSKRAAKEFVRFGPDTAVLMALVKVPNGNSFDWYLLARRKYQFAARDLFIEFSRGFIKDELDNNQGWKLFERDFPGLKDNPIVTRIFERQMGNRVWENNAQFANKISYHLIVVELEEGIEIEKLQELMVGERLKIECPDENLEDLSGKDLFSHPMVIRLSDAARSLNAHLTGEEEKLAIFGENYSTACWSRFLSVYGWQFPEILPEQVELI